VSTVGTRWYTLAEAAPVLGVSVDTVRRRLKRGELESRQVHTQHGPTWEVRLGVVSTEHNAAAKGAANGAQGVAEGGAGVVELVVLVDRLQRENRDLAGQVGFLTAQLAAAQEQITALQAPQDAPERSQGANLASETPEPVPEPRPDPFPEPLPPTPNGSPWWRRWLGALYG
jgi:excisionase family DNA binding protein